MAYLDYVGLAYFKSLLDETYLRTDYSGDTTIQGNVTFTEPVDADVKNDYLGNQIDKTYIKDIVLDPEGSGALALVLGDGSVSHLLTNTTVSQVRSSANELYPVLLCYDANAEEAQITKTVKYVHDVQINPSTGYISAKGVYVKHPTFNRRNGVTQKVEWAYDFTDGVTGLGNPMSQVYAYVDPAAQGGEHCIELRLYGNPNVSPTVPSINDSTNTFSIGVGVTGGNVQFGYCPSTPLYLDNGSTLRTEATGHGTDIITRDWLNLNGSFTGLVHTTMNETIDGAKTFKKTVTINSGDNNNKAGLYVQGNSDVHGNEHVYGTETIDGKLTANGTAEIKGGSGSTPSLTVTGDEKVTGNSSITGNSNVGGNETISGKITSNNGAEINGGNGLVVNGNETVNGEIYKLINNIPQEYVSYVTNKQETKTTIVNNLIKDKGGLAADSNKNIYVNTGKGLNLDSAGKINVDFSQLPAQDVTNIITGMVAPGSGLIADSSTGKLAVDFNQMPTDKFQALLKSLKMLIPLSTNINLYVDKNSDGDSLVDGRGTANKPFKTIQAAVNYATSTYSLGNHNIYIRIAANTYQENLILPEYSYGNGAIILVPASGERDVKIKGVANANGFVYIPILITGGKWVLHRLITERIESQYTGPDIYIGECIQASGSSTRVTLKGCKCIQSFPSGETFTGVQYPIRVIGLDTSAEMHIAPDLMNMEISFSGASNLNRVVSVFNVARGAKLVWERPVVTPDLANNSWDIVCSGDCTNFIEVWQGSTVNTIGGGPAMEFSGNVTGKRYSITYGSFIAGSGSSTFYPGTIEGTVDSNTYCWYA